MSSKASDKAKTQAYLRILQNPYASLSLFEQEDDGVISNKISLETKRARFREMQNPHAFHEIFEEKEAGQLIKKPIQTTINFSDSPVSTKRPAKRISSPVSNLEKALDEVLHLYKPFIARNEWSKVSEYRSTFLELAKGSSDSDRVLARIENLKFSLQPNEKVQYNRAPSERIISELQKLLK